MSRHTIEPRLPHHHGYEIAVGWDAPMGTFFAEVIEPNLSIPVDLGHSSERILNPGVVLDAIRPYADIPPGLHDALMCEALVDLLLARTDH